MITDKMVMAAAEKLKFRSVEDWAIIRAALEAAETAAWCEDIGQAPRDEPIVIETISGAISAVGAYRKIEGYEYRTAINHVAQHRVIKRWRHLPQPKAAAQSDMPVKSRSEREAEQCERMKARFANRKASPATADFDLPAPNDTNGSDPVPARDDKMEGIGRLAMRVEGNKWTAYYAMPETFEHKVYLGQIAMRFVRTPERKEAFMSLMKEAVSDILEEITGTRPLWPNPPKPAPESERSGSA